MLERTSVKLLPILAEILSKMVVEEDEEEEEEHSNKGSHYSAEND